MAGHDLLPGCMLPWKHDECSGYQRASVPGGFDGIVCHCPCHGLKRRIAELESRAPDEGTLCAALPEWLNRIAPSIRAFVAHTAVQNWPQKRASK